MKLAYNSHVVGREGGTSTNRLGVRRKEVRCTNTLGEVRVEIKVGEKGRLFERTYGWVKEERIGKKNI